MMCRFHHGEASTNPNDNTMTSLKESYEHIVTEKKYPSADAATVDGGGARGCGVGWIQLHRPKALNALCDGLFADLIHAAKAFDQDPTIGCLVISGAPSTKAFAAGADIAEMSSRTMDQVYLHNMCAEWTQLSRDIGKPIIAAVHGYCLGGGCELAMMCDIVVATKDAQFGQPEINLGVIPGAGGTQRLIRAIGKSKAMYYILTGDRVAASELEHTGLFAKLYDTPQSMYDDVLSNMAMKIARQPAIALAMAKEAVNAAEELSLSQGLRFERRLFHALFATHDQKEGMQAFLQKRKAEFQNK
jgi:enoyl-CoA hydratase/carnithine racemase